MKPFVLTQHEKDFAAIRELRDAELGHVSGGLLKAKQLNTITVTPNSDGGDDGSDE
ncbi:hypothetical protein GCM10027285_24530 [Oleiagrimonas citrea]|jgi:hypothetical protein|uniref:Uncharacterized protein n=1 Tax=Oleiagrimonas citrea TaxID=1665687 RepID=A0A846ZLB0_9GAMM|nr:hypothetical protein [Oleiagrimonas citrea]NKZ38796.1 hypothetical protein [Oleiagrimonas citrea]